MEEPDKILVRSNGTVTYTAKDIAYQLWKFGLLGVDFDYERFSPAGTPAPSRAEEIPEAVRAPPRLAHGARRPARPAPPPSGAAARVINVIDVRQSYPQKVVKEGLRVLGFTKEAEASVHFSYEIVALTPKAARRARGAIRRGVPADARGREEALRRDVGPQGARRQGRRPRRAAPRALAGRDREPPRERRRGRRGPRQSRTPARSPSGRCAISC